MPFEAAVLRHEQGSHRQPHSSELAVSQETRKLGFG